MLVAVTIVRLPVRRNFEFRPLGDAGGVKTFENQPSLSPRISEVDRRSQKIALGRLGCAQLKFFGPRSRDLNPTHKQIWHENPLYFGFLGLHFDSEK